MFCVRKLSDDEQIDLIENNVISEKLIDMCTQAFIEMESRIYVPNKNEFSVYCVKSICKTVLNLISDPGNTDVKMSLMYEKFFQFMDSYFYHMKNAELLYDTIKRNCKSLEYVTIENSISDLEGFLLYSPRLHLLCKGLVTTGIKQVLISLNIDDEKLNQCLSNHENLDPEEHFVSPKDIFKLIVNVPNIFFHTFENFEDDRYQRLEGIVDVENANKIKRWDSTLKKHFITIPMVRAFLILSLTGGFE